MPETAVVEDAEEVREREREREREWEKSSGRQIIPVLVLSCCRVILDGFSTFVVNSDGLIAVHKMDRVEPVTIVTSTDIIMIDTYSPCCLPPPPPPHTHTHTGHAFSQGEEPGANMDGTTGYAPGTLQSLPWQTGTTAPMTPSPPIQMKALLYFC